MIASTGYRFDLQNLPFFGQSLTSQIRKEKQLPQLSSNFESAVPGLYFTGIASANSFGSAMRFLAGTGYTARRIASHVATNHRPPAATFAALVSGEVKPAADQDCQGNVAQLDTAYPTLILKASRGVIHHGALAVARTLGRQPVYAVVEDGCAPLALSRYLTRAFVWERWPDDPASFLKEMSTIAEFIDHPTVIIPMDDLSAVCVAENAVGLARWFLLPQVPPQLPRQLANKASLYALCAKIGIPSVRSVVPHSVDDVRAFAQGTAFRWW